MLLSKDNAPPGMCSALRRHFAFRLVVFAMSGEERSSVSARFTSRSKSLDEEQFQKRANIHWC